MMSDYQGWLGSAYLWIKAFHLIFVIFWMAGLFMLPRFFAYHTEYAVGSAEYLAWNDREKRLLKIIINPAMIFAWVLGLMLVIHIGLEAKWLWVKFVLVLGLVVYHGILAKCRKAFVAGTNTYSSKFYRLMNEIPTLATIPIVILVIVQPF
jgi:protoporphyrinogen IX oxidase